MLLKRDALSVCMIMLSGNVLLVKTYYTKSIQFENVNVEILVAGKLKTTVIFYKSNKSLRLLVLNIEDDCISDDKAF